MATANRLTDADPKRLLSKAEIETSWVKWLGAIYREYFPFPFSVEHIQLLNWAWKVAPGIAPPPVGAWLARGHGKSTLAEIICVMMGARRKRKYVLYVSRTQEQADDHVGNIAALLESPRLTCLEYYPEMGDRLLTKFGHSKGWRRNRVRCSTGFTVDALGLDTAARGARLEENRPDVIIFDDIDQDTDSQAAVDKIATLITRTLIPAGSSDCAFLFAQNLVHENSIASRLVDGRADFLQGMIHIGPTPAIRNFTYEKSEDGRTVKITGGTPTWEGMNLDVCQEKINKEGLRAFLIERQHNTSIISGEKAFPEYDEKFHIITWSEFAAVFGVPHVPERAAIGRGLDWGTTAGHPSAVIYVFAPHQYDPCSDCVFVYREIIRPVYPIPDIERIEAVSPGRLAEAMARAERPHGESERIVASLMSHEATAALNTMEIDLKPEIQQFFSKWVARKGSGVAQIQEVLSIDNSQLHPFRHDPRTGKRLRGRPRIYFIVSDGQGELYRDAEGHIRVRQPTDAGGLIRLRQEIPVFNERSTGANKKFDDAVDALRGIAASFFVPATAPTKEEEFEHEAPVAIRAETIRNLPTAQQRSNAQIARMAYEDEVNADNDTEMDDFFSNSWLKEI